LVFKNGFVGLLACAALAGTPAVAKEHGEGPPPDAGGQHGMPPGQENQTAPEDAEAPPSDNAAPPSDDAQSPSEAESPPPDPNAAPPASEPETEAPPDRQRVTIRSDSRPAEPPASTQIKAELLRPERLAGGARPESELEAVKPPAPAADSFRQAIAAPPADVPEPAPAAAAASLAPERATRGGRGRSERVAPAQPLAPRIVAAQVRRIVEVVPAEIWALLAGLALLTFVLAGSSWAAARKARRLRRQREDLLQEVGLLQEALLPAVPAGLPVSVAYRPANGATAGGDFYDAFERPGGGTGMILGDVSGHGREALARTTFVRYTLRAYLEAGLEPREVLRVGSVALAEHLEGEFATVLVAVHDPRTGRITYASAGHPPPIVSGCARPYEPVTACSSPPIGIGESTGFRQSSFTLTAGARACLYTDGVTEARAEGQLMGVARLERALEELPPGADADSLLDAIAQMADEVPDDMAVCLIEAAADAPEAGPRIEELEVDGHEAGDSLERFLRACGVALSEVPGVLREAGEAARREGSATVRVRSGDFRPGVDVVPRNLVRLSERRRPARIG
jgi:hypothetical protein